MNSAERLAAILGALQSTGIACLVMGGHAVRFYGLERNTVDYDLHLASEHWSGLEIKLASLSIYSGAITEGDSWRPGDFRRFQIGRLPDGREEWLEFWRHNHLLAPFPEMYARRESGVYGGRTLPFVSLPDLIRSKETECIRDWLDIDVLEEVLDQRSLARVRGGDMPLRNALSQVRSRAGLESYQQSNLLADPDLIAAAIGQTVHPLTQALLLPFSPAATLPVIEPAIENVIARRLRSTGALSRLHLALVEAVRKQYREFRRLEDHNDKQAILAKSREHRA